MIRRLCLAALVAGALPFAATAQMGPPQERYIVVLNDGLDLPEDVAADVAIRTGGRVGHVYENALRGFSIVMPRAARLGIERDPRVDYVEQDQPVSIFAHGVPTGIDRIFATGNPNIDIDDSDDYRVDVDVAVIDTGVDFEHPDLNVVGGVDCSGGSPFVGNCKSGGDDDQYHGTHVAGTIAAIDNGFGVVGVAPGARIWAVKVLRSDGSGYWSWIIAGIDWVAANADTIEVANMSLGGGGYSQAGDDAIQGAVDKGVAFAVSAGNSNADANNYSPAAFDNVLTVSALADFDGVAGGDGSPTCRSDQDDTLADFSNWGSAVQIAAPGVCILSTYPIEQGGYGTISGTSMASPHAAGALALLASANNPANAADVYALYDQVINSGNFNWVDDSGDGILEPLLDVTGFSPTLVGDGGGGGGGDDTNKAPTADFNPGCTDLACEFTDASSDTDGNILSWAWDFGDGSKSDAQNPSHTYVFGGTYTVKLTVTDDDGATGNTSKSISVSDGTGDSISVSLAGSATKNGPSWEATVTATVSGGTDVPVKGNWSPVGGTGECTATGTDGTCQITNGNLPNNLKSVTFTVTSPASAQGTEITIARP